MFDRVLQFIYTKNHAPVLAQNIKIRVIVLFCANLEVVKLVLQIKAYCEE